MERKPKLESWSYDEAQNNPELYTQQAVSWSAVANGMTKDQSEHIVLRRGLTVIALIVVLILSRLSFIFGIIAAIIVIDPIIIAMVRGNKRPSKKYEIIA